MQVEEDDEFVYECEINKLENKTSMIIDIPLRLEIPQGNLSALRNGYDTHGEEYRILKTRVIAKDRCQPQSEKNKTKIGRDYNE